jgi:hypothetical protein
LLASNWAGFIFRNLKSAQTLRMGIIQTDKRNMGGARWRWI